MPKGMSTLLPARLRECTRLRPTGKASIIFAAQELQVQAIAIAPDGTIYAATSPDGKVYKIVHGGPAPGQAAEGTHTTAEIAAAQEGAKPGAPEEKPRTAVAVDASYSASVFFDPKTKYIWALQLDKSGQLYVGTGDRGQIFRVDRSGSGSLFFQSDEAQIRCLALDNSGNLIAGTDGSGLVYRISPQGEAFVLYAAPKKEITALAIDAQGNIYAAGAGEKRGGSVSGSGQSASQGGGSAQVITIVAPSAAPNAVPALVPLSPAAVMANLGGSDIYRISPDGSPRTLWSSKEDLVYALTFDSAGRLLAGTGNKGRIYTINGRDYVDLVKASADQVMAFARAPHGGMYAATSNLGKSLPAWPGHCRRGHLRKRCLRCPHFLQVGTRGSPAGPASSTCTFVAAMSTIPTATGARGRKSTRRRNFRHKLPRRVMRSGRRFCFPVHLPSVLDAVTLFYLPKNVAPEVDDVVVNVGARVPAGARAALATSDNGEASVGPATVPDKQSIAVKWKAHDANDDDLVYSVYYRGDGETRWKQLRDGVENRYVNLESDLFADGGYTILVVASDAPSHSPEETLTGQATSPRFEVDNTPPHVESLNASVAGNQVHLTFRAVDSFSPIARAEYSIDAGDWQIADPVGQISDYKIESYDFNVPIPSNTEEPPEPSEAGKRSHSARQRDEHTIVIRVFDRFENVGIAKTVVRTAPPGTP